MRKTHHRYADYFYGTADELDAHDGFRIIPNDHGRTVPIDLCRPLVATRVERFADLVSVELIDRSSMVEAALCGMPDGCAEVVETVVFEAAETVLIRG